MANERNISTDLYDLLVTRNFDPEVTDAQGQASQPAEGAVFSFDYVSTDGQNYGTAVAVIDDGDQELSLYFGDNLGKSMEEPDKSEWFEFLRQLSQFATRHNFHTFSPKNLNNLKHTMAGMAAIKEGLFEGYYGNRRTSYMGEATDARLVIEHNKTLGESDARHRNIKNLFIETAEGERFKLPFVNLAGGRAMLEHVRQGGRPYDVRGVHIAEMVSELKLLNRFNRASSGRVVEGVTAEIREQAHAYYNDLRENLRHLAGSRGYQRYFESWSPADISDSEALVEDLKTLFVEQTIDARIEAALPILAKIQQGSTMKEAEIFETWVNAVAEGTWAVPDTPEKIERLRAFMSKEQPVGPDAANATTALYDVIGDDDLFDKLGDLARDNADADARIAVKYWIDDRRDDPEWSGILKQIDDVDLDSNNVAEATRRIPGPHGDLEISDTPTGKTVRRVKYQDIDRYEPDTEPDSHPWAATLDPRQGRLMRNVLNMKEGDNLATFVEDRERYQYLWYFLRDRWGSLYSRGYEDAKADRPADPSYGGLGGGSGNHIRLKGGYPMDPDLRRAMVDEYMAGYESYKDPNEEGGISVGDLPEAQDPMDRRGAVTDSFYEELDRIKSLALPK